MCPVYFEAASERLICPCHEGAFSPKDGSPIYGPPRRPLPEFRVELRENQIWLAPHTPPVIAG